MAKAYKQEAITVVLELTQEEAETLEIISRHTGGSPADSRRKYTNTIGNALRGAGVDLSSKDDYNNGSNSEVQTSLWFKDMEKL